MQQPAKINYKVYQGATFQQIYRWESGTKVYTPITQISRSAPCIITTQTNSNLPVGSRFRVVGVTGMKEINSIGDDSYYLATDVNNLEITINQLNSIGYNTYTSGGVVEYNQPVPLTYLSARMQIRETIESSTVIYEASSAGGEIVVDDTLKTITLTISAATTQNFTFETAVYSIELFNIWGTVIPFLTGNLVLVKEVTR